MRAGCSRSDYNLQVHPFLIVSFMFGVSNFKTFQTNHHVPKCIGACPTLTCCWRCSYIKEGVIQIQPKNKHDLRMRARAYKDTSSDQNKQAEVPTKASQNKGMPSKTQKIPLSKLAVPEIKESDRTPTYFILEHELRKIKIYVPLT
jgi:hypothetical protein